MRTHLPVSIAIFEAGNAFRLARLGIVSLCALVVLSRNWNVSPRLGHCNFHRYDLTIDREAGPVSCPESSNRFRPIGRGTCCRHSRPAYICTHPPALPRFSDFFFSILDSDFFRSLIPRPWFDSLSPVCTLNLAFFLLFFFVTTSTSFLFLNRPTGPFLFEGWINWKSEDCLIWWDTRSMSNFEGITF